MVRMDKGDIEWTSLPDSFLYSPGQPEACFKHNDPSKYIGDHMLLVNSVDANTPRDMMSVAV